MQVTLSQQSSTVPYCGLFAKPRLHLVSLGHTSHYRSRRSNFPFTVFLRNIKISQTCVIWFVCLILSWKGGNNKKKRSPTRCCRSCLHYRSCCPPWLGGRRWHCLLRRWAAQLPSLTPAEWGHLEHYGYPPHCSPTAGRKKQAEQTQQTQTNN